jgi:hypothetical protein
VFALVIRFIGALKLVATFNYSDTANSHSLRRFPTARARSTVCCLHRLSPGNCSQRHDFIPLSGFHCLEAVFLRSKLLTSRSVILLRLSPAVSRDQNAGQNRDINIGN